MLNKLSTRALLAISAVLALVGTSLVVTAVYGFITATSSVPRMGYRPTQSMKQETISTKYAGPNLYPLKQVDK